MLQRQFAKCSHPEQREIGDPTCYTAPVAVYPYTDENPAAHGNICVLVECVACGARRHELHNGRHAEVAPWYDERGRRERERRAEAKHLEAMGILRREYGDRADVIRTTDGYIALRVRARTGDTEILIGTSMADAVTRTRTTDARKVRTALASL